MMRSDLGEGRLSVEVRADGLGEESTERMQNTRKETDANSGTLEIVLKCRRMKSMARMRRFRAG